MRTQPIGTLCLYLPTPKPAQPWTPPEPLPPPPPMSGRLRKCEARTAKCPACGAKNPTQGRGKRRWCSEACRRSAGSSRPERDSSRGEARTPWPPLGRADGWAQTGFDAWEGW